MSDHQVPQPPVVHDASPRPDPGLDLAVFLPSLAGGGAERIMVMLCNELARRGKRVALVLALGDGPYLDQVDGAVRLVRLGARSMPAAIVPLAGFLRQSTPAVLLSGLDHANLTAILARTLAASGTRLVVSEHNTLSEVVKHSQRPFVSMLPFALRLTYPRADAVIAVSRGVADDLSRQIGLPRERIEVVYNPVLIDDVRTACAAPVPHPWFDAGEPPVVLTAGRMTRAKDHANLVDAFARLRASRHCRLVILGEGPLRSDIEHQVERLGLAADVLLPGFQANPFAWMSRAAVFALASRHEGFANVLVEAMACGVPIVSTDCPSGPAELLDGGKWGRLVPVGDSASLAAAVAASLDETLHVDVTGRAADYGLDRAVEDYSRIMGIDLE